MGFDHFHPCCDIDGHLARLRGLGYELLENEASGLGVSDEDITANYRLILDRLTVELARGKAQSS